MMVVAIVEAAALVALVVAFAGVVARVQRACARREDLLVNQLCHLAGRDWHAAPADDERRQAVERADQARVHFIASPEQQPMS